MAKQCDLQLTWIRRDINQVADDLRNEKFDSFDAKFWIPLKGVDLRWRGFIHCWLTRMASTVSYRR